MCVPREQPPAAQPSLVPSMQAASAFQAGGDNARGAAQIGRLALRLGGPTALNPTGGGASGSSANAPTTPTPAVTPATPTTQAQEAAAGGQNASGLPLSTSWLPPATAFTRIAGFGPITRL